MNKLYLNKLIENFKNQQNIEWNNVKSLLETQSINYNKFENLKDKSILNKVAILKLNGGLGTSMGCTGPKSVIKIKNNLSFLDIICNQINVLNNTYKTNIPLILMNSLNTELDTKNICKKYDIDILHFNQNFLPRLNKNFTPLKESYKEEEKDFWYPPGHGDIYNALLNSSVYTELKQKGIKYIFISNSDNLGATFDAKILEYMHSKNKDFIMEVVEKTLQDVKGGTLINYNNRINLLEVAQVLKEHLNEFYDIKKFKYFNTNNIWLNLDMLNDDINMEVIYNPKKLKDRTEIVQLEIAMGSAIKSFEKSAIVVVGRDRFKPVKKCQDLFLLQSDLYELDKSFNLVCNTDSLPLIKFSDDYKKIQDFRKAFPNGIPKIINLKSLTVDSFRIFTESELEGHDEY